MTDTLNANGSLSIFGVLSVGLSADCEMWGISNEEVEVAAVRRGREAGGSRATLGGVVSGDGCSLRGSCAEDA